MQSKLTFVLAVLSTVIVIVLLRRGNAWALIVDYWIVNIMRNALIWIKERREERDD